MSEIHDAQKQFQLFYATDLSAMKAASSSTRKRAEKLKVTTEGDQGSDIDANKQIELDDDEDISKVKFKPSNRGNSQYGMCVKAGLGWFEVIV